jgi:uracil-DNA glycosylase
VPGWFPIVTYVPESFTDCQDAKCFLRDRRNKVVLGEGHPHPDIVFVGEGPGEKENEEGRPFIGEAGVLLNQLLASMTQSDEVRHYYRTGHQHDLIRNKLYEHERIYITNSVLCGNGHDKPRKKSLDCCRPRLQQEIYSCDPKLIVALGGPAATALLGYDIKISGARGNIYPVSIKGVFCDIRYPVLCTYHPSFLLRNKEQAAQDGGIWQQTMGDIATAFHLIDQYYQKLTGATPPQRGL